MRIHHLCRKALSTFTLTERLFQFRERFGSPFRSSKPSPRRTTRLNFDTCEERIVPSDFPDVVDYYIYSSGASDGGVVAGAVVTLYGGSGESTSGVTGSDGCVHLDGIPFYGTLLGGLHIYDRVEIAYPAGYEQAPPPPIGSGLPATPTYTGSGTEEDPFEETNQATFAVATKPLPCKTAACATDPMPQQVIGNEAGAAGNPADSGTSDAGVRYADGVADISQSDYETNGFGTPWGLARSYSNPVRFPNSDTITQAGKTTQNINSNAYSANQKLGAGWVNNTMPHLRFGTTYSDLNGYQDFVMTGTSTNAVSFNYYTSSHFGYNSFASEPSNYKVNNSGGSSGEVEVTDELGNRTVFFNNTVTDPKLRGQFKRYIPVAGAVIEAVSYTSDGNVSETQRVDGTLIESQQFTYTSGQELTASATLRRSSDSGTTWETLRTSVYTYEGIGAAATLTSVEVHEGTTSGPVLNTEYYRYYGPSDSNGPERSMKLAVTGQSFERMAAFNGVDLSTVDTLTDSQIQVFAERYYEYDSQGRVTQVKAQGLGCSVCNGGTGQGTYEYSYTLNSSFTSVAVQGDDPYTQKTNIWKMKTVETLPDGTSNIVYTNQLGEVILKVFEDSSGMQQRSYSRFDSWGRVVLTADAVAVTGYSESNGDLVDRHYCIDG